MTESLLAIDLGTSATKILAVDRAGTVLARRRVCHATHAPTPDAAEQDPNEWWRNIRRGIGEIARELPLTGIRAIGVTGKMHGLVAIDAGGCCLRGAITWQDRRSASTLPALRELLGVRAAIEPGYQAASWHWLDGAEPEIAARAADVLLPNDEIVRRLTGARVTDPSDAIGTGWYDPIASRWDLEVVEAAGARADLLPEIVPSGSVVGAVLPEAADELSVPSGIPVVIAGGDAAVAALGAGATGPGSTLLMLSTGCQVLQPVAAMETGAWPSANPPGLAAWLRVTATRNAGNVVAWARETFGAPATVPDEELVFLPYLAGERSGGLSSHPSGAFVGLRERHTPADMARAAIEGVTLAAAAAFCRSGGTIDSASPLFVGGGGVRDDAWLASVARVFACEVRAIDEPDLSAWGAARSTATALGWIDPVRTPDARCPTWRRIDPTSTTAVARDRLDRFQKLARRPWGSDGSDSPCVP